MEPYLEGPIRERFDRWHAGLVERFTRDLTFTEIRKGVQALSAAYVSRKAAKKGDDPIFSGAGKRAAFAVYYGPLHFLTTWHVIREIGFDDPPPRRILDLGCGTGVAGAAWAAAVGERPGSEGDQARPPKVLGLERSGFAMEEARLTYRAFGLKGEIRKADLERELPREKGAAVLAFTANELTDAGRGKLSGLLARGTLRPLLILEPLARKIAPWWGGWESKLGSRALALHAFEWRKRLERPEWIAAMDKASGLDHAELTARVLGVVD